MNNQLGKQASLYLRQHASNPVAWQSWGEDAIETAREEDKPILLSIGYSACHWCHVMAHESFEDDDTADVMNKLFINIKVDKEQRPDLDKVYQAAHHLLTGQAGGWPLTIFLEPKTLLPFYSGTYFPPEPRHGLPAFKQVLEAVAEHYQKQHARITQQHAMLKKALESINKHIPVPAEDLNDAPFNAAQLALQQSYDNKYGGFVSAPKFPMPSNIEFLLDYWQFQQQKESEEEPMILQMALQSLVKMAQSGLNDHVGGGFFRYCVDEAWTIPHFEKMLYDNAQLLGLCSRTFAMTEHSHFKQIITETAHWLLNEMAHPEGGFYASIDADSDEGEGAYYVWDKEQVAAVLNHQELQIAHYYFGLEGPANFEGKWHLQAHCQQQALAEHFNMEVKDVIEVIDRIKHKLLQARTQRQSPKKDKKLLTSWNGLTISALAKAGFVLDRDYYIRAAQSAVDFIHQNLWEAPQLKTCYANGSAQEPGFLDDYVFLLEGLLQLLQAEWRNSDIHFAIDLAEQLLAQFYDEDNGGFYYTAHDHEDLIQRPKSFVDEAIPAANGVAVKVLLQLGYLLAETRYIDAARKTLQLSWKSITEKPQYHTSLLCGLENYLEPTDIRIVRLHPSDEEQWVIPMEQRLHANQLIFIIPMDLVGELPPALISKQANGYTTLYHCKGMQCVEVKK